MKTFVNAILVSVVALAMSGVAQAETVTYVGSELNGAGQKFRDTAVEKAYNTVSGEYYGSAGYILWYPSGAGYALADGASISDGGTGGTVDLPSWVSGISVCGTSSNTGGEGFYIGSNATNIRLVNDPSLTPTDNMALTKKGMLGSFYNGTDTVDFITMTLGEDLPADSTIGRIGILLDTYVNNGTPAQYATSIQVDAGTTALGATAVAATGISDNPLVKDGTPDLHFFDLTGFEAGDTITIALGGSSYPVLSGLTFDTIVVPEPSSIAMLLCGLAGLIAYAWRKRK